MKKRNTALAVILLFCVGSAFFCLRGLTQELRESKQAQQLYSSVSGNIPLHSNLQSTQIYLPCQNKLSAGGEQFSEQIAWLSCPETTLDYPVVQGLAYPFWAVLPL